MKPWKDKVGLIIGANSSLGAFIIEILLEEKMVVIGVDNNDNHLESLNNKNDFHFIKANLNNEDELLDMLLSVEENFGGVDVLVNNIEVFKYSDFLNNAEIHIWQEIWQKKILSLSLCSREAIRSMVDRKIELGQIINVLYYSGEKLSKKSHLQMYATTKNITTALTTYFRQELEIDDKMVKVTNIQPNFEKYSRETHFTHLDPKNLVSAIKFALNTPLHVQVREVVLEKFTDVEKV